MFAILLVIGVFILLFCKPKEKPKNNFKLD